ncbi:GNAT family N-acetyltransferase [Geomicrobium sp. JCM 19039]|uniref:GNAT family N-acetyltransferase n=1 Tax=Geomicrobium sp. JCM 19039 TaxID=1460636 RepID=UPI00045F2760|nr:GNAT family N-acetyltransferase [Geomicrobium sp. JCM 19039]GAK14099.1 acetyltransferase, GNAT family [Geomicrobium sp. JCM 19039]
MDVVPSTYGALCVNNSYKVERLTETDVKAIHAFIRDFDWDYSESDVRQILTTGHVFGCKDEKGVLLGCAALITYEKENIATLGLVMVDPTERGRGLGRQLTVACVDAVPESASTILIATGQGQPLYEKLGFVPVSEVSSYVCQDVGVWGRVDERNHPNIRAYDADDFEAVVRVDERAFGDSRHEFLKRRIAAAKRAFVWIEDEKVVGYGLSVSARKNVMLGPIVCQNVRQVTDMICSLVHGETGSFRMDTPHFEPELDHWLHNNHFKLYATAQMMVRNGLSSKEEPSTRYAIAAQIFG